MDLIRERMEFGKAKYGHGVRVTDDTTTWGTPSNSWMHMALEERERQLSGTTSQGLSQEELPLRLSS